MTWGTYRQDYERSDMTEFRQENGCIRLICPACREHKQANPNDAHDCKNLFVLARGSDGRISQHGQCMCWSEAHGLRD